MEYDAVETEQGFTQDSADNHDAPDADRNDGQEADTPVAGGNLRVRSVDAESTGPQNGIAIDSGDNATVCGEEWLR